MAKKRISIDKERFETLKNEIVKSSGIDLSSDKAYSDLADYIKKQSEINFPPLKGKDGKIIQQKETISVDTLRRYWGEKDADKDMKPDIGKLSLISRALGYKDWETFSNEYEYTNQDFDAEKGFNAIDFFNFSSLCIGEIICVGWYPQKYCRLKFLGKYSFEVVESYRMKSKIGRNFETSGFRLAPAPDKTILPEVIIEPLYEYEEHLWDFIKNFNMDTCPPELLL